MVLRCGKVLRKPYHNNTQDLRLYCQTCSFRATSRKFLTLPMQTFWLSLCICFCWFVRIWNTWAWWEIKTRRVRTWSCQILACQDRRATTSFGLESCRRRDPIFTCEPWSFFRLWLHWLPKLLPFSSLLLLPQAALLLPQAALLLPQAALLLRQAVLLLPQAALLLRQAVLVMLAPALLLLLQRAQPPLQPVQGLLQPVQALLQPVQGLLQPVLQVLQPVQGLPPVRDTFPLSVQ